MPKISVIIPAYNHADTLPACLDSIFSQTLKDLEVIVVNDGSTDETDAAVKPYLDRIIYKTVLNGGAPKARNAGFALSTGDYVMFCDADLVFKPEALELLLKALNDHAKAAYAYCGFRFGWGLFRGLKWSADRLRKINYIHTSALIRRAAFIGFDESIKKFQDWDMWLSMLEKGKTGVAVNKILFSAKPRKNGMSWWLPKVLYSGFFKAIGMNFKSVAKYDNAAAIIAKKHGLELGPDRTKRSWLWAVFLACFVLSAIAFGHPWVGTAASLAILALTFAASLNQLVYGVGVILGELIIGSLAGRTLVMTIDGRVLPLRMALFAIVGVVWLMRILQRRIRLPQKNLLLGVMAVLVVVGWGVINGLSHHLGIKEVVSDANAYLALPLIWFFVSAVKNEQDQAWLKRILKHGAIALSVVTVAALYFFSHKFANAAGVYAYKWLRDSRIAEITALESGAYRVFIQSQLFCLLALAMILFSEAGKKWRNWIWGGWPAASLFVSASRSFVLGLLAALFIWTNLAFMSRRTAVTGGKSSAWALGKKIVVFAVAAVIIFLVALKFPVPAERNQKSFQEMLSSKNVSEREAAITSRWSLLKELNAKIMAAPFLGSGFGTTVTYLSSDPRILSTTGGSYTTAAFEWNYHDILIKMGLLGLLAYGYLLFAIFRLVMQASAKERQWLLPSFFALLVLNAVSPFLNHPLGIGFLALLCALAEQKRGALEAVPAAQNITLPSRVTVAVPGLAMINEE